MPIETDLKSAYSLLYDAKKPEEALELYEAILSQSPDNFTAHIYKAACLEKLYYGFRSWHNDVTLQNALELLEKAMDIAKRRGDRSKLALANFRLFVHHYNRRQYPLAKGFFDKAQELGYLDDTLVIWEANLKSKLQKWERKHGLLKKEEPSKHEVAPSTEPAEPKSSKDTVIETSLTTTDHELPLQATKPSFKTDWYQSAMSLTISLFITSLPKDKNSVAAQISSDLRSLEVTYPIPATGSEFQYSTKLSHEVDPNQISVSVLTKKIEITLTKKQKIQWKRLDDPAESSRSSTPSQAPSAAEGNVHTYPTSSRKTIDWSKIDVDEDEKNQSADAFFQQLYSRADPDTQRAMMKSMIESNGTALNTNWEEVAKKTVETVPPKGAEVKQW
ncbi:LAME_0D01640g1_1 [Lachancea meyersii CBS 8951]|uniref:LAME_0D01640g1_1 n=1 Tax=Lachancea meyersii CBS 8951 TaxID=1266667 RepID=A0A1G4J786_9SACH|nr:LAME_0D01640g1_1 [Lachancea meyersii CBS 8951]